MTTAPTALALGPLEPFFSAGVIGRADAHVAAGLLGLAGHGGHGADLGGPVAVPLAVALVVRALRDGSVCLDLAGDPPTWVPVEQPGADGVGAGAVDPGSLPWPDRRTWADRLAGHRLVAVGTDGEDDRPLRLVDSRLYLQRYWADERLIATVVRARATALSVDVDGLAAALNRLFPAAEPDAQRLAVATAALRPLTIVTGGPGTGKTTTVARLLAVLRELSGEITIGLAAPTGKAAARLQEAVAQEIDRIGGPDLDRIGHPAATTVHRLLGWRPGSRSRFRHHAGNPLPHDVVVVDECSMVSLPLMARLLEALRPDARIVLVGDPDQLASIDAGAVLGDLVAAAAPWASPADEAAAGAALAACCPRDTAAATGQRGVVRLERVHRFGGRIAELSAAIRAGHPEPVLALLATVDDQLQFVDADDPEAMARVLASVRQEVRDQDARTREAAQRSDAAGALAALDSHRVLCAHRSGPHGIRRWSELLASWVPPATSEWYPGRPLLVTGNDPTAGVYNGDTGVVILSPADGSPRAAFARGAEPLLVAPGRIEAVETLRALTIHRGQGSQFATVTVVLPPEHSPLLTRELLYTAVTRARERVRILGTPAAVALAVTQRVKRASGLRDGAV